MTDQTGWSRYTCAMRKHQPCTACLCPGHLEGRSLASVEASDGMAHFDEASTYISISALDAGEGRSEDMKHLGHFWF
jgi:hypothetical protein